MTSTKQLLRAHVKRTIKYHGLVYRVTEEDWENIKARYQYRCAYCRERKPLTMDHVKPLAKGGAHHRINLIPACHSCNAKKGTKPATDFHPLLFELLPARPQFHGRVIDFGQYKGRTYAAIAEYDPRYLRWVIAAGFPQDIVETAIDALKNHTSR